VVAKPMIQDIFLNLMSRIYELYLSVQALAQSAPDILSPLLWVGKSEIK
jgi:hypothetical protein